MTRGTPDTGRRTGKRGPNTESGGGHQPAVRESYEYRRTSVNIDSFRRFDRGLEEPDRRNSRCRSSQKKYACDEKVFEEPQDHACGVQNQSHYQERVPQRAQSHENRQPARAEAPDHGNDKAPGRYDQISLIKQVRKRGRTTIERELERSAEVEQK